MNNKSLSLEEISKFGEKFYNEELKDSLEKQYLGQYVVIDVEQKKYQVDADRLVALEKAKKEFGDKLFCIIQIGNIQNPIGNIQNPKLYSAKKHAWNF